MTINPVHCVQLLHAPQPAQCRGVRPVVRAAALSIGRVRVGKSAGDQQSTLCIAPRFPLPGASCPFNPQRSPATSTFAHFSPELSKLTPRVSPVACCSSPSSQHAYQRQPTAAHQRAGQPLLLILLPRCLPQGYIPCPLQSVEYRPRQVHGHSRIWQQSTLVCSKAFDLNASTSRVRTP